MWAYHVMQIGDHLLPRQAVLQHHVGVVDVLGVQLHATTATERERTLDWGTEKGKEVRLGHRKRKGG
jgi:hypothetical protein